MRLIVLLEGAMIQDVICGNEQVLVGSHDDCRIKLEDARIAAQQLLIQFESGAWRARSLDPACLVKINGRPMTADAGLSPGDELQLASFAIRVYPDFEERGDRSSAAAAYSRLAMERFAQSKLPSTATVKRPEEPVTIQSNQVCTVGRASVAAANSTSVQELMDAALKFIFETFDAQRAWIGVRRLNYGAMDYVEGRMLTGQATDLPPIGDELKPRCLDRGQFVYIPMLSSEERVSILAGPLPGPDGPLGMMYVDTGDTNHRFDFRDLELFVLSQAVFAHQLDALLQVAARNRAAQIEGQVSVAHECQTRLTPRKLPQSDELQFGAFREPGHERSGDIYDVMRLNDGTVALFIAQTPATGALPPILMTQVHCAFRYACMHQDAPNVFLQALNWVISEVQREQPLHCFAGRLDPKTGELRYSVAGAIGALIISQRGEERALSPAPGTAPLGAGRGASYPALVEQIEHGETLVLFTQGVTTARNRRGEVFGQERFVDILCDNFGQAASASLKEMLTDLRNFTEGGSQPDDITVILSHRPD